MAYPLAGTNLAADTSGGQLPIGPLRRPPPPPNPVGDRSGRTAPSRAWNQAVIPPGHQGVKPMAFVVCQPCHDCKYTDCVVVCPCDCFYQDDMQLYIDPDHCVDCDACARECPVEAIFHEASVPVQWAEFIQINAERVA